MSSASAGGRVMPSPVRLLLGAAVVANIGLITYTVYDNKRRKKAVESVIGSEVPSAEVVRAGFPSAAVELLVVEARGWSRRIVTVEDAQRFVLDAASDTAGEEEPSSRTACDMITAFGDGSGRVSIMRVLAACPVNVEIGTGWIASKKELTPEAFSAEWAEEEEGRAALLFRVLEAKRGVPTDKATLMQSLDEIGVPEPFRGAVPASLISDDSVSHKQQDSTTLTIKDFTTQPLVVMLAREGLAQSAASVTIADPAKLASGDTEQRWDPRSFIIAVRAVMLAARSAEDRV